MACVSGELLDEQEKRPPHADGSLAWTAFGGVEVESRSNVPRSLTRPLELGNDVFQRLVVANGEGALVAA